MSNPRISYNFPLNTTLLSFTFPYIQFPYIYSISNLKVDTKPPNNSPSINLVFYSHFMTGTALLLFKELTNEILCNLTAKILVEQTSLKFKKKLSLAA